MQSCVQGTPCVCVCVCVHTRKGSPPEAFKAKQNRVPIKICVVRERSKFNFGENWLKISIIIIPFSYISGRALRPLL